MSLPAINKSFLPRLMKIFRFSEGALRRHAIISISNTAVFSLIGLSMMTLYAHKALASQNSIDSPVHIQVPDSPPLSRDNPQQAPQPKIKIGTIDESKLYLSHPQEELLVDTDEDQPVLVKVPSSERPYIMVPGRNLENIGKDNVITEDDEYKIPALDPIARQHHPVPFFKKVKPFSSSHSLAGILQSAKIKFVLPLKTALLSSPFGLRHGRPHQGIDLAADYGSKIYSADAGKVVYAGWEPGYGNTIILDHGHGIKTRYAHCSLLKVDLGETVQKMQLIGLVGSTGHSTGPHLHFEVMANDIHQNPEAYLPRLHL